MSGRQLLGNRSAALPTLRDERTGPDPTFIDQIGAGFRTSQDEVSDVQYSRLLTGYSALEAALIEQGVPRDRLRTTAPGPFMRSALSGITDGKDAPIFTNIWAEVERARKRDPKLFGGLPASREEYERRLLTQNGRRGDDQALMQRGSGVGGTIAQFGGAAAGTILDPSTILTTVLGSGSTSLARVMLTEGIIGVATEGLATPTLVENRAALGDETTAGQIALNIAAGGFGSAGLAGAMHVGAPLVARGIGRVADGSAAIRERTIAGIWDRLPENVRQRWANASEITDQDLPDLAEAAIGRDNLSEDEAAAIGALRRDAAIESDSPFIPNGAGEATHRQRLGDAVSAILADVPPPAPPRIAVPSPATRRAALGNGTAIGSGTVPMGREAVKARIGRAESPSDSARNPLSSATGRYQFTRGTFVAYHKRVFGGDMSDAARWAQATDGGVQERLMDALLADNAAFLKRQGEAESAGNLYLVHFVGQGGARKLFAADPAAPVGRVLGEDVVKANPFLRGRTVADTIAWAHQRMGGPAPARAGARAELAGGIGGGAREGDTRARLQSEIDALQAEALARDATPVEARDVSDMVEPVPTPSRPVDPVTVAPVRLTAEERATFEGMGSVDDAMAYVGRSVHAQQAVHFLDKLGQVRPDLRAGVIDRIDDLTLNVGERARPAERARLRSLLEEADAPVRGTSDNPVAIDALVDAEPIVRAPKARTLPVRRRPSDIVEFLADRGGLRDDEGHLLRRARDMGDVFVPRAGPLLRPKGMGIDEAGEYLWEAGFFRDRPTETEVLDMLERAVNGREKIYALPDQDVMAARALTEEQEIELDAAIARLPDGFPLDPVKDRDALMDVLSEIETTGADAFDALARLVDERVSNWRERAYEEGDYVEYRPDEPNLANPPDGRFGDAGEGGIGQPPVGSAAERGGGPAAYGPVSEREAAELIEAQVRAFGEPEGEAPRAQVESVEHDLRMVADAVDPAIAERQRQEAALKAASPMRPTVDQDSTIGLGLFDATDQTRLKFEDGSERSLGEMFDDLDGEGGDIDLLRACLPPGKAGGAGV